MATPLQFTKTFTIHGTEIPVQVKGSRVEFRPLAKTTDYLVKVQRAAQEWLSALGGTVGPPAIIEGDIVIVDIPGRRFTEDEVRRVESYLNNALTQSKGTATS